ncbi:DUF4429 domain-containing protein [Pseudonocardia lacus]|uniref:DUF4429 domain-containing protein n=1 Tax=Pseudonocardia lacus TaxID=2835865 RepID=UPI001BDBE25F|nr:DUF4429 domain-containing protein [Pseudonocardia lacus]
MSAPLQVRGHNGTVTYDGKFVTITRTGFLARTTIGKGEKRIPLRQITAVQLKPAGFAVNGFIQFSLGGGREARSQFGRQTTDAVKDENSVIFTRQQQAAFDELRSAIEHGLADPGGHQQAADPVAQLNQLAQLHRSGALTDAEFTHAKQALLGQMR